MKLKDLKIGDKVMLIKHSHWNGWSWTILVIDKETKTQFAMGDVRIRKSDGYEIGTRSTDGWGNSAKNWEIYDIEKLNKVKEDQFKRRLKEAKKAMGTYLEKDILIALLKEMD